MHNIKSTTFKLFLFWMKIIQSNDYSAFGAMDLSRLGPQYHGKSKSICYKCWDLCEPEYVLRPLRRDK